MKRVHLRGLQMMGDSWQSHARGFTLTEMLVSMAIFLVICGSAPAAA
jgi:prepilin-type N-terminal cleavage/methylation domain-containing protein